MFKPIPTYVTSYYFIKPSKGKQVNKFTRLNEEGGKGLTDRKKKSLVIEISFL